MKKTEFLGNQKTTDKKAKEIIRKYLKEYKGQDLSRLLISNLESSSNCFSFSFSLDGGDHVVVTNELREMCKSGGIVTDGEVAVLTRINGHPARIRAWNAHQAGLDECGVLAHSVVPMFFDVDCRGSW